jgi:D-glycero-beta-D-manno-heptose 1-phosphate adenylyltransferase
MLKADIIRSKIKQSSDLPKLLSYWRFHSRKIVFTNGCFDLIHPGHVDYLCRAADLGDVLIVGLNSDSSVRGLGKGDTRPIQDQDSRAFIMASLQMVTSVIIFDEPTPLELIKIIEPDVLVKGGDWKVEQIVGADVVVNNGGEVKSLDFIPGFSTTSIEQKILKGK